MSASVRTCVPTRTYLTYNYNKPWLTAKLIQLRQAKEDACRSGDKALYKQAKITLNKEITVAKRSYCEKPSPATRHHPPALWRINNWRFKKPGLTPHTTINTPSCLSACT